MMRRRQFLMATGAVAAAAALPAMAFGARPAGAGSPFRLARLERTRNAFVPVYSCVADACASTIVRLRFDAFHGAEPQPVLYGLRVQALFDVPGAARVPYLVWDHRAGRHQGNSSGVSFVAGRECMRRLALDYSFDETTAAVRADCALTGIDESVLEPGHYVLAGPRGDGRAADLERFLYSGSPAQPLLASAAGPRAFDYLAFRIEALA